MLSLHVRNSVLLLTLPVRRSPRLVDGNLARTLPSFLRAPLTAAIGAAIASGVAHGVHDHV